MSCFFPGNWQHPGSGFTLRMASFMCPSHRPESVGIHVQPLGAGDGNWNVPKHQLVHEASSGWASWCALRPVDFIDGPAASLPVFSWSFGVLPPLTLGWTLTCFGQKSMCQFPACSSRGLAHPHLISALLDLLLEPASSLRTE